MRPFQPSMVSARKNTNYSYPGYTDGKMARGFLYNLEQDAKAMQKIVTDDDTLPPWVTWKIYTAEDRLQAATRYMQRQKLLMGAKQNPGCGCGARQNPGCGCGARQNPEEVDYYSPRNVAVVVGFMMLFGYLINKRRQAAKV